MSRICPPRSIRSGGDYQAVSGVSFQVHRGEILGVVGESGCGKSVTSQSILRLYDERREACYSGEVLLEGRDLLSIPIKEMQRLRGSEISMIFQDALSTLNPVLTIGYQLREPMRIHEKLSRKEADLNAVELLRLVGIPEPEQRMHQYPHELSGGMRQRVMIAIALACRPKLLIADEPTTALDVTIQAQIMALLLSLNRQLHMGVILITHDLAVVAETCSRAVVMYLGQVVEEAPVEELFRHPLHPYTQGLIASVPHLDDPGKEQLHVIPGTVPFLEDIPTGCRFAPRCPYATDQCRREMPQLQEAGSQRVRCWHIRSKEACDMAGEESILRAEKIYKNFPVKTNRHLTVRAVSDVSLTIRVGEIYGLVGESGCGKSTLGRVISYLIPPTSGKVWLNDTDLSALPKKELRRQRQNIQMVFQDCLASMDPQQRVGDALTEGPAGPQHRGPRPAHVRGHRHHPAGGAPAGAPVPLSPRVLRRAAAAHRPGPRAFAPPGPDGLRRAGFRPGRLHPGADFEPAAGSPAAKSPQLSLHRPRHQRGQAHLGPHRRHVSGPPGGGGGDGGAVRPHGPPLHQSAALCGPGHQQAP